ncbi:MAG: transposase, partial [Hungatella sp.]
YKHHRFPTFTKGLRELAEWLKASSCSDVCMESTGKYWIPVYNILELSCKIVLAHPKYVRAIRGKKTDKKDAKWIADIFKHDLVAGSFIPPLDIRQLRDLMRYLTKLTNCNTGEKNRAQNCLTVSNIGLASVVSDVFGKSASAITDHLLNCPNDKDFDFRPLLQKSLKKKADDIALAIDGNITFEQGEKMKIILAHMDSIETCKT